MSRLCSIRLFHTFYNRLLAVCCNLDEVNSRRNVCLNCVYSSIQRDRVFHPNLTQEIVDYLNENDVEVWVSHDGDLTSWLRGIDVLEDEELKSLILQIKNLTFSCCCTNKNPDPWACYQEIKARVERDFFFHFNAVFADSQCKYLVDGFDYSAFRRGAAMCICSDLDYVNPIKKHYPPTHCNVLPNGDLVGMAEIHHKYGTVLSNLEDVVKKQAEFGDKYPCKNATCEAFGRCIAPAGGMTTEHFCKVARARIAIDSALRNMEAFDD